MAESLENLINELLQRRHLKSRENLAEGVHLRLDLGLDSLDLAVLAIRIQEVFKVNIYASGNPQTFGEIKALLNVSN